MAQEYSYPRWIEEAWNNGMFTYNNETQGWKYNNQAHPEKQYKYEFNPIKDHGIENGDIIDFEGGYRNQGKWIWDGQKKTIKSLYTEIDDYGSVPPKFKVGKEFKPDHWVEVIDHNSIIWLEDDLYKEIILSTEIITQTYGNTINGNITLFNNIYTVNITYPLDKDIEYVKNKLNSKPAVHYVDKRKLAIQLN